MSGLARDAGYRRATRALRKTEHEAARAAAAAAAASPKTAAASPKTAASRAAAQPAYSVAETPSEAAGDDTRAATLRRQKLPTGWKLLDIEKDALPPTQDASPIWGLSGIVPIVAFDGVMHAVVPNTESSDGPELACVPFAEIDSGDWATIGEAWLHSEDYFVPFNFDWDAEYLEDEYRRGIGGLIITEDGVVNSLAQDGSFSSFAGSLADFTQDDTSLARFDVMVRYTAPPPDLFPRTRKEQDRLDMDDDTLYWALLACPGIRGEIQVLEGHDDSSVDTVTLEGIQEFNMHTGRFYLPTFGQVDGDESGHYIPASGSNEGAWLLRQEPFSPFGTIRAVEAPWEWVMDVSPKHANWYMLVAALAAVAVMALVNLFVVPVKFAVQCSVLGGVAVAVLFALTLFRTRGVQL